MKRIFLTQHFPTDGLANAGLLAARLLTGTAFLIHGWPKIQNPTSWAGDSIPGALQLLAAVAEFGGGVAWILGLLVPLASLGVLATMAYAKFTVHGSDPFVAATPGGPAWEQAGTYAAFAVLFFTVGSGRFSLDFVLNGLRSRESGSPAATPV